MAKIDIKNFCKELTAGSFVKKLMNAWFTFIISCTFGGLASISLDRMGKLLESYGLHATDVIADVMSFVA